MSPLTFSRQPLFSMPSYLGAIRAGSRTFYTKLPFTARCDRRAATALLGVTAHALHASGHAPLDRANLYYALHCLSAVPKKGVKGKAKKVAAKPKAPKKSAPKGKKAKR